MSRDRDGKFEQALKHELRATGTPATGPALRSFSEGGCVDAETLGAWTDGGLDAVQMAAVELHVATCGRCQAIVGATARSSPSAPAVEGAGAFSLWRWWLAPIAATAAAVTLWMVVPPETVQTPASPPAPVVKPDQDSSLRAQSKEAPSENKVVDAKRERNNTARDAAIPARKDRQEAVVPAIAETVTVGAAAQAPASAPAPAPAPAAAAAPAASAASAEATLQKRFAVAPIEIVSPNSASRWRVLGGALERSEDSGLTWTPIEAVGASVTGGAAPATSICWLIGRGGLVMVTVDGLTFARVPLPERVDVTAITATDARSATVTTADGRQFRTADSGRNWRQN